LHDRHAKRHVFHDLVHRGLSFMSFATSIHADICRIEHREQIRIDAPRERR
jgi:hypothetical protein